jgi:hypothetical protein
MFNDSLLYIGREIMRRLQIILTLLLISFSLFSQQPIHKAWTGREDTIYVDDISAIPGTIIIDPGVVYAERVTTIDYNAHADSLFAKMFPEPTATRKAWINEVYDSLDRYYADSVYVLYFLAADNLDNSIISWYGNYPLTAFNSPSFHADTGWTGNGSNAYLLSTFNPVTAGVNQNLASAHVYIRTNETDEVGDAPYSLGSGTPNINLLKQSTYWAWRINAANDLRYTTSDIRGLWSIVRKDANNDYLYLNGVQVDTEADVSSGVPNAALRLLNGGTLSGTSNQISMFCLGRFKRVDKFKEIIERYLDHLGCGIL